MSLKAEPGSEECSVRKDGRTDGRTDGEGGEKIKMGRERSGRMKMGMLWGWAGGDKKQGSQR